MYLIKDKTDRYLKLTIDNQISFTNNESLADVFPNKREATDFIRKTFSKKNRKNYKVVQCDESFVSDITSFQKIKEQKNIDRYKQGIDNLDKVIDTYLNPEIEKYQIELQKYDDMTLDILHFIRDEDTKLNACQGYEVFKTLQKLGRERAACKKELQRVSTLKSSVQKAVKVANNFEYDEYKNRYIENVAEFIFAV